MYNRVLSPIFDLSGLVFGPVWLVASRSGFFITFVSVYGYLVAWNGEAALVVHGRPPLTFKKMADFDKAQKYVHHFEGGFQIDARDKGNWTSGKVGEGILAGTNWGISAMFLTAMMGKPVSEKMMKELTYEEALIIYRNKFWDFLHLGVLKNQQLATLLYDGAVNQGTSVARDAMKYAIRHSNAPVMTGVMTTKEIVEKLNTLDPKMVHELVWEYRKDLYHPASVFYKGWMKRLNALKWNSGEFPSAEEGLI
jgi:lysozyme family protein